MEFKNDEANLYDIWSELNDIKKELQSLPARLGMVAVSFMVGFFVISRVIDFLL